MSASVGRRAARSGALVAVALPWCATLRTSMAGRPRPSSAGSTSSSASPVSRKRRPLASPRRTIEVSLIPRPVAAGSVGTPGSGQSAVSEISSRRRRAPVASVALGGPCIEGRIPGGPPRSRPVHAGFEHPPNPVPLQHPHQARDVILVGMGQHDDVDPPVPGRDALVQGHQEAVRVRPAIDQHARTAPALDQDRVALPHVEHHEPRRAPGDIGHRERGQRNGNRRDAKRQPAAARGRDRQATGVRAGPGSRR